MAEIDTVLVSQAGCLSVARDVFANLPVYFRISETPQAFHYLSYKGQNLSRDAHHDRGIHTSDLELYDGNISRLSSARWCKHKGADKTARNTRCRLLTGLIESTFRPNEDGILLPSDDFRFYASESYGTGATPLSPTDERLLLAKDYFMSFTQDCSDARKARRRKRQSGKRGVQPSKGFLFRASKPHSVSTARSRGKLPAASTSNRKKVLKVERENSRALQQSDSITAWRDDVDGNPARSIPSVAQDLSIDIDRKVDTLIFPPRASPLRMSMSDRISSIYDKVYRTQWQAPRSNQQAAAKPRVKSPSRHESTQDPSDIYRDPYYGGLPIASEQYHVPIPQYPPTHSDHKAFTDNEIIHGSAVDTKARDLETMEEPGASVRSAINLDAHEASVLRESSFIPRDLPDGEERDLVDLRLELREVQLRRMLRRIEKSKAEEWRR